MKKVVTSDSFNIFLASLRVVLCWVRYIFYDIQIDGVDLALHYSDSMFSTSTNPTWFDSILDC
jgi:hypothetical protein